MYQHNARKVSKRGFPGKEKALRISLAANAVFLLSLILISHKHDQQKLELSQENVKITGSNQQWHGGHPAQSRNGSCLCGGDDQYCMCTPDLAVDLIITSSSKSQKVKYSNAVDSVWLVRRRDTDQLATMGGFVEINETVENAVKRELKEEMGYDLTTLPKLVGVYSDPRRDSRRRTVSVVFVIHMSEDFHPHAGDDAKEVIQISIDDIEKHTYFSDHRTILLDYRAQLRGESYRQSTNGDFAVDIIRSTCPASATIKRMDDRLLKAG
ncbi:NUDIX family hydrolase [Nitzschia inconspicua]|uniref:NUDIX family hydrolase n=1 Tax=Nitzschia inconspicua TaxID=303405 RepID=A0A9K3LG84_9STRA|nr:NUDIX family hydrolase [Nitzschia inconspicua]